MNISDIRIEDYPIGTATPEIERRIVAMTINEYEASRKFIAPISEFARMVIRYLKAEFFDDATYAEMEAEDKIPIEISEGWPKYLAELGMAKGSKKVGVPTAQVPEDGLDASGAMILLNAIREKEGVEAKKLEAFADNLLTGYPQFVWVEKPTNSFSPSIVDIDRDPWDCTIPDMNSRKPDYSDADKVYRIRYPSKDDLLSMFPDRKEQIEEAFKTSGKIYENCQDMGLTIEDRDQVYSAIEAAVETTARTGRVHLIQRHSLIKKTMDFWVTPEGDSYTPVQEGWDEERIAQYRRDNPGVTKVRGEGRLHWVTSILATGQLLENRPHWYQDQRFNCEVLNLMLLDGKPVSVMGFAAANWYLSAIAKTEHIHQLRLDSGNPVVIQEGGILNPQNIEYEVSKPRGKIIAARGRDVRSVITRLEANRTNPAWDNLYAETRETNDRLTVDQNVEGSTQSSQESAKVVSMRVNQASTKYSKILDNANDFYLRLDNLILRAAQRLVKTDHLMMHWMNPESGKTESVEVNAPDTEDLNFLMGDEPSRILNRLDLTDYNVVMAEGDNSITGRATEMGEFVEIMQSVGQSTPPEYLGEVLSQIPNRICKAMGEQIMKNKQAAANQPQQPEKRVNLSLDLNKLMFNQPAVEAAKQLGIEVQQQPAAPPAQAGEEVAQPGAMAPEPGMSPPPPTGEIQ